MDWTVWRRQMYAILEKHFNLTELKVVTLFLGIDDENLKGETISERIIELIKFCERHGQRSKLLQACQQRRPDLLWPTIERGAASIGSPFFAIERSLDAAPFRVLVWGPRQVASSLHPKREALRDELRGQFPEAQTLLSEEFTLYEQEIWFLLFCDLCVILDTSSPAREEWTRLTASPTLRRKLMVLTIEQYSFETIEARLRQLALRKLVRLFG